MGCIEHNCDGSVYWAMDDADYCPFHAMLLEFRIASGAEPSRFVAAQIADITSSRMILAKAGMR
jgi:hypothetical protein